MESMAWTGLGESTEVTSERWQTQETKSLEKELYHRKSKTHYWVLFIKHNASEQLLDALDGKADSTPILDSDTIAGPPQTGCFICEQPYDSRLRSRSCPGEPR